MNDGRPTCPRCGEGVEVASGQVVTPPAGETRRTPVQCTACESKLEIVVRCGENGSELEGWLEDLKVNSETSK